MFKNLLKKFSIILFVMVSFAGKTYSADLSFFTIGTGGTA